MASTYTTAQLKLTSLQVLRGIAASAVVFFHFSKEVKDFGSHNSFIVHSRLGDCGRTGVDVFFVISGFIMAYTTVGRLGWNDAQVFLKKRVLRIYPLYWIASAVYLIFYAGGVAHKGHQPYTTSYIVSSFLLIPKWNGESYSPMLAVGWTLSFEMLFYLVFSAIVLVGIRQLRLVALSICFIGLSLFARLLSNESGIRYLFSQPIMFEFLLGVLAADVVLRIRRSGRFPRTNGLAASLACFGILLLAAGAAIAHSDIDRVVFFGIPSFFIVLGFAMWRPNPTSLLLVYLGDASYSIYLLHSFLVLAFGMLLKHRQLTVLPPDLLIVIASLCAIILSGLSYRVLERPLNAWVTFKVSARHRMRTGAPGAGLLHQDPLKGAL